jgi:hypothetical protein
MEADGDSSLDSTPTPIGLSLESDTSLSVMGSHREACARRRSNLVQALSIQGLPDAVDVDCDDMCTDFIEGKSAFEDAVAAAKHIARTKYFNGVDRFASTLLKYFVLRRDNRLKMHISSQIVVEDALAAMVCEASDDQLVAAAEQEVLATIVLSAEQNACVRAMPVEVKRQYDLLVEAYRGGV